MKKRKAPCRGTRLILGISLPLLTLSLITILIAYLIDREAAPVTAALYYRGTLEYIFSALAITVGGCLLSEIVNADKE